MSGARTRTRIAAAIVVTAAIGAIVARGTRAQGTSPLPASLDSTQRVATWDAWRAARAKAVLVPGRPLSYTGLTWLHEGVSTVGAASGNDVKLPGRDVPARIGLLVRQGVSVRFEPTRGTDVTVDSVPRGDATPLRTDAEPKPSQVRIGSAGFRIVKRLDSIGVRAWDAERASLRDFKGITHFPFDARWRFAGKFAPLATPRRVAVMTESGVPEEHEIVGTVETTIDGARYAFTAFRGPRSQLFLTFADGSSGEETYGFRFLQAPYDSVSHAVVLDFNYAYNPDCAFSPFTTCPLPPPENRIKARLLGGERKLDHERGERAERAGQAGTTLLPEFAAATLDGKKLSVGGAGDSVTLLNVWATWCTSCREEMQDLEQLHRTYTPRGVRVVAVSVDAGSENLVRRFVTREQLSFPVIHDREGRLQAAYHVSGVPTTFLIGRDGRVLWQRTGGLHGSVEQARQAIESAGLAQTR